MIEAVPAIGVNIQSLIFNRMDLKFFLLFLIRKCLKSEGLKFKWPWVQPHGKKNYRKVTWKGLNSFFTKSRHSRNEV